MLCLKMKKIFIVVLLLLVNFNSVLAKDYVSKNPNHLKRGLLKKVYITKLKNKEAYQIIKDPTGVSPIELIEVFSPKKGDCSNSKHWGDRGGGVTDCNSGRQRMEISEGSKEGIKKSSLKKKAIERWYGYYLFVPNNYPLDDEYLKPYINQFFGFDKNTRGGHAPSISGSIVYGNLNINGTKIIDKENLKGKWHKIEYHIKWSIKDDGFIKIYHNEKLKGNRDNIVTMYKDYMFVKYGIYNARDNMTVYPSNYEFPDQTLYFAGYSVSSKRGNLKINKTN